jgi:hypothetical protein
MASLVSVWGGIVDADPTIVLIVVCTIAVASIALVVLRLRRRRGARG